jgi:enoyl-CoA hydratase/carnithine racemase
MSDLVRFDVASETATITLSNPDVRNSLSVEMAEELIAAVEKAEDSDARCLVVQGSGGFFCAGGDIKAMVEGVSSDMDIDKRVDEFGVPINRSVQAVYECSLPTIAKVDGPAFGAGGALAIACDIVLASERAKISFGFRQVGLSVDSGTSFLLPRQVGENVAKELVYTGELIDSDRGTELGLFNRVFPDSEFEQRCQELIDHVATGPTVALEESKRLLETGTDRTFGEAVEAEVESLRTTLGTADHAEGARSFVEQRDPEFEGR